MTEFHRNIKIPSFVGMLLVFFLKKILIQKERYYLKILWKIDKSANSRSYPESAEFITVGFKV